MELFRINYRIICNSNTKETFTCCWLLCIRLHYLEYLTSDVKNPSFISNLPKFLIFLIQNKQGQNFCVRKDQLLFLHHLILDLICVFMVYNYICICIFWYISCSSKSTFWYVADKTAIDGKSGQSSCSGVSIEIWTRTHASCSLILLSCPCFCHYLQFPKNLEFLIEHYPFHVFQDALFISPELITSVNRFMLNITSTVPWNYFIVNHLSIHLGARVLYHLI